MRLLHKDLAYELTGCFYHVQNTVGLGFDEETYHQALEEYLRRKEINFQSKVVGYLEHRGKRAHKFIADFIIDNKVIVELKCSALDFVPANYLQTISYLKNWRLNLGLLVNFGQQSVKFKRIPYSEKKPKLTENYSEVHAHINKSNNEYLQRIRMSILYILNCYGLGYNSKVYKTLLQEEFHYNNLSFSSSIQIPVFFEEKAIRNFKLEYPLIHNTIICGIDALQKDITTNISKMKNYLRKTGYPIGLVIHFGKEKLDIVGVNPN